MRALTDGVPGFAVPLAAYADWLATLPEASRETLSRTLGRARGRPGLPGRRVPVPDGRCRPRHAPSPPAGEGTLRSGGERGAPYPDLSLPSPPSLKQATLPRRGGRKTVAAGRNRALPPARPRPVGRPQGRLSRSRRAADARLPRVPPRAAPGLRRPRPSRHPRHHRMAAGQGRRALARMLAGPRRRRPAGGLSVHRRRSRRGGPAEAPARRRRPRAPDTLRRGRRPRSGGGAPARTRGGVQLRERPRPAPRGTDRAGHPRRRRGGWAARRRRDRGRHADGRRPGGAGRPSVRPRRDRVPRWASRLRPCAGGRLGLPSPRARARNAPACSRRSTAASWRRARPARPRAGAPT